MQVRAFCTEDPLPRIKILSPFAAPFRVPCTTSGGFKAENIDVYIFECRTADLKSSCQKSIYEKRTFQSHFHQAVQTFVSVHDYKTFKMGCPTNSSIDEKHVVTHCENVEKSDFNEPIDPIAEKKPLWKVDLHIVPPLLILFLLRSSTESTSAMQRSKE